MKILTTTFTTLIVIFCSVLHHAQANDALAYLTASTEHVSPEVALSLLDRFDAENKLLSPDDHAQYYFLYGQKYEKNRQLDLAIESYDKAIAFVESLPVSDILIDSYLERSFVVYLQTNDPATYCIDRRKALAYARQHTNATLLAKTLTQNAFCYNTALTVHKGIALLDEAMVIVDKSDKLDVNRKALIYNATGSLYRTVGLHKRAYENFNKAYLIWQEAADIQDMFNMQHNMLSSAIKLSDWDKANANSAVQFELAQSSPQFEDFYFFAHLNAGRIELGRLDYAAAISHLEAAVSRVDSTQEQYFISSSHLFLAQAYMRVGEPEKAAKMARLFQQNKAFPSNMRSMFLSADAIMAFDKQEYLVAINTLFQLIDEEREQNRKIIQNEVIVTALVHNSKLADFENELLANQLSINKLKLSAAKDKERINELKVSLFILIGTVLLAMVFFLLHSRETFKRSSQTDFLTGIANRGYTINKGERLIARSLRKGQSASVIIFDIDNFKAINDQYGHHIGDQAIQAVTMRAERWLKSQDLVGRIGGEEFLIVLPNTNEAEALAIADRIRSAIAMEPCNFADITIEFTVSLGVAVLSDEVSSLGELMKEADKALYKAKFLGKNRAHLAKSIPNNSVNQVA
ncbi:GGDEF domain-containing protein [Shewanella youngdeokensis]|uniref:diguanylate cyclase n=1 Tax=Shewanella youngdeokensis TaxID=2999068 RepID=A0ABZ0K1M2_9GAMM|nr:GGDEF domain-containing protein [Shewanella sp. DAU334]